MSRGWTGVGWATLVAGTIGVGALLWTCRAAPAKPQAPVPTPVPARPTPATPTRPAPVPAIAPPIRTPRAACVEDYTEPRADGVVCWSDGCLQYAKGKRPVAVAPPARNRWPAEAEVRDDGGHLAACSRAGCVPLGPQLADAIERSRRDNENSHADPRPGPLLVEITSDRAVVTLANARLVPQHWNVALDRPITFAVPKAFARDPQARLLAASPIGTRIALLWEVCPKRSGDYCDVFPSPIRTSIADTAGRDLDGEHDAYQTIFQVAADRFVLAGEDVLQLVAGGHVVSRVPLVSKPQMATIAEAGSGKLVALVSSERDWGLVSIATGGDRLAVDDIARLPDCH